MVKMIALFLLLCSTTALAVPHEEFNKCAQEVYDKKMSEYNSDTSSLLADVCNFYQKDMQTCIIDYNALSDEEQSHAMRYFLFNAVIIPACGTPDEVK